MRADGWYKQYRAMFDHPVLQGDVTCRKAAWSELVGMAEFTPTKKRIGSTLIDLNRGELVVSVRYLAKRWKWSKGKVQRFLACLEAERMLSTLNETPAGTVYRVVNYALYQGEADTERDTKRDSNGTPAGQSSKEEKNTPTTTPEAHAHDEAGLAQSEMWQAFEERYGSLTGHEREKAAATVRGIITGDTYRAWETPTGDRVPWSERPRLFRLALDERSASGGKLFNVLRGLIVPREFDPFAQRKSTDPKPGRRDVEKPAEVLAIPRGEAAEIAAWKASNPDEYARLEAEVLAALEQRDDYTRTNEGVQRTMRQDMTRLAVLKRIRNLSAA